MITTLCSPLTTTDLFGLSIILVVLNLILTTIISCFCGRIIRLYIIFNELYKYKKSPSEDDDNSSPINKQLNEESSDNNHNGD